MKSQGSTKFQLSATHIIMVILLIISPFEEFEGTLAERNRKYSKHTEKRT